VKLLGVTQVCHEEASFRDPLTNRNLSCLDRFNPFYVSPPTPTSQTPSNGGHLHPSIHTKSRKQRELIQSGGTPLSA